MSGGLLIMHDSPDYGGHERMLLQLLPAALDAFPDTLFCYTDTNARLGRELSALEPRLRLRPWPFVKRRGEPYLGGFRRAYARAARSVHTAERPGVTLLAQGRIENCVAPLLALPRSARIVSYLPMAQSLGEMGRNGSVGDRVRRRLYARPNAYIVPSEAVARQVRRAHGLAQVTVAPNVVPTAPPTRKQVARAALGLDVDRPMALVLGRLAIAQKGVDILAQALERDAAAMQGWTVQVVGDGPGRALLENLRLDVRFVPWSDRPDLHLCAADVLLLPSRWEGLPLTVLEAMQLGVPVLGADIDVLRELLPDANRMDYQTDSLAVALGRVTAPGARTAFEAKAAAFLSSRRLELAQTAFAGALTRAAA